MSGIGMILNTAKTALLTQQYAIDVVSNNVANVDSPGYSRQVPILQAKNSAPYGGFLFGTGVDLENIARIGDEFIETQLNDRKTVLMALDEKETYMSVLEGVFNENSGGSLSAQFAHFWNAWHDLSNNPSGYPERNALFEMGTLLCHSFNGLSADLEQFDRDLNLALASGTEKINQLTREVADLNGQIVEMEGRGPANDLRDLRDLALSELAEYLPIKWFANEDGSLTVMVAGGYNLVDRSESCQIGMSGEEITWEGSGDAPVYITDKISGGKMGGWLDMREEILPKYKSDLDEIARSTIWETNKIHTQGVGLEGFTDITGTFSAADKDEELWTVDSGVTFYDRIVGTGSFEIWVCDGGGTGVSTTLDIDAVTATSLQGVADTLDGIANLNAEVTADNRLRIYADAGYSFAFQNDTSYALAALGVNTFFGGGDSTGMEMNDLLNAHKEFLAAGRLDASGEIASGDNSNALGVADLQYQTATIRRWTYERGGAASSIDVNDTLENCLHVLVGSVGIQSQSIARSKAFNEEIVNHLNETRQSISGVSLDEEMTNLIRYQQAYSAAARLIGVADEMLQTLLDAA